jgi:Raf kinase inhibitor-like YbhB/YbcL family protein
MKLTSAAFGEGERIPVRHTCEDDDVSPPLAWSEVPAGTKGLALVCADPDAPAGTWYHWAIFDLPAGLTELKEGIGPGDAPANAKQATTDFGKRRYGGPCPPPGHGTHRYYFTLTALDVERLPVGDAPHCRDVEMAVREHALAEAVLLGTYSR